MQLCTDFKPDTGYVQTNMHDSEISSDTSGEIVIFRGFLGKIKKEIFSSPRKEKF